jgi:hypothetical protein
MRHPFADAVDAAAEVGLTQARQDGDAHEPLEPILFKLAAIVNCPLKLLFALHT